MKFECFISVDVEADGPIPGEYSMLSVGAAFRWRENLSPTTFYREITPISPKFVQEALDVSRLDRTALMVHGASPAQAMADFESWIERAAGDSRPVFVGFNATFDWQFVNYYFHRYLGRNPFGIAGLDIKAYYMGKFGLAWGQTAKSRIPKALRPQLPHTHHAKDDAIEQLVLFEQIRSAT